MAHLDLIHDMLDAADDTEQEQMVVALRERKPPVIIVPSLRDSAINLIVKSMDFWMEYLPVDPSKYLYILSPFDVLGSKDTLEILKRLVDSKRFQRQHLHFFFHEKLHKMDFNILSRHDIGDSTLSIMFNRCKNIRDLTISVKSKLTSKTIDNIPMQYPHLEHLKMSKDIGKSKFVELLADNCKSLKSLILPFCSIVPHESLGKLKQCTSLQCLKLHHVSHMPIQLLENILISLKKLTVLSLMESSGIKFFKLNQQISYPNIKILDLSWSDTCDKDLAVILSVMHNVLDLCISNCKLVTTGSFSHISVLNNLQILNISYLSSYHYNFDSNVELCLIKVGPNLTSLDLSGINLVQTNTVAKCCPYLRKLVLNHCCYAKVEWINANSIANDIQLFNWLTQTGKERYSLLEFCRYLEILCITSMRLDGDDLEKIFLGGKQLKQLKFLPWSEVEEEEFTEEFVMEFFTQFHFDSLEELDLTSFKAVGINTVLLILKLYPRLNKLRIVNCNLIEQEFTLLTSIINDAKLCIQIEVSCHSQGVATNVTKIL